MTTQQVLIMAGFDYQGGGVDFLTIARNRRARLLAKNPALTVTIMDVGSGTTFVSAMVTGAASGAKPARKETSTVTHSKVTSANYSTGLGHHARFNQNQAGRMSITDLYTAIQAIGLDKATAGTLIEVSVFSHGWMGGPILVNSMDNSGSATARDPDDKDARLFKDFISPNFTAAQLTAFRAAFAPGAFWWNWGCAFTESYRQVTHRFVKSSLYRGTASGKLKDTDKVKFDFSPEMAEQFYSNDAAFFPQTKHIGGANNGKFKELDFERTVKDVREFFLRGIDNCYHHIVAQAANVNARGAFLGTFADYEENDKSIKLPLMAIPRNYRIFKNDFTPYINMWIRDWGFAEEPEGHGYGIFAP